ncbi:MAG: hypothetical protein L0Z70_16030 [Chloroflexi bacterium]|nr:hypothetical protein [Chloroflexota bacterium]
MSLDEFRQQAESLPFEEEPVPVKRPQRERRILGMTAAQRFVVALMLLFIVCLLSALTLLATGKVTLPL